MRVTAALCALTAVGSCAEPPEPWYKSLQADSPCYRVDLTDGLDEDSTAEVQDLFWCANHNGHLASLEPTAAALESASPGGSPAAIELARASNALPDVVGAAGATVSLSGMLETALGLVQDEALSSLTQDIALEAIYGESHNYVRQSGYDLRDPDKLDAGLLPPLGDVVPELAAALQDDPESLDLAADILEDPETRRWIYSVDGWIRSDHPDVKGPVHGLLPHLGEALVASRSPENDRWRRASGHSLRDLVDTLAEDDLFDEVSPELRTLLGDATIRRALPDLLVRLQAEGHLQVTPAQTTWMAEIDTRGGTLQPGEDSALRALLRLLDRTNRPMQCTVDLWVTTVDVNLGNLAVTLLRILADQDPDDVQSVAAIMGEALGGYGIGEGVLRSIADTGACPALTDQVVDDLYALERLGEPQTRGLTHTLIGLVRVLRDGEEDRIEELVDVIGDLERAGAVEPLEEVLRDIGEGEIGEDLVNLVAVMDDPGRYGIDAHGESATTLEDLLELLAWLVEPGDGGKTGWKRVQPLLTPALEHDGTWTALDRAGILLAGRQTRMGEALDIVPALIDADPELQIVTSLGPALRAREVSDPTLRLLQTHEVVDALLATRTVEGQEEVPLAFGGRLITTGAVDDLLRMLRIVVRDIEAM